MLRDFYSSLWNILRSHWSTKFDFNFFVNTNTFDIFHSPHEIWEFGEDCDGFWLHCHVEGNPDPVAVLAKQVSAEMTLEEKTGHAALDVLFNKDWSSVGKKGDKVP